MIISANTSTYRKTKERHAHFRHGVAHNPENRYSVELVVDFGVHRFKPFIAHQRRITHRHHKRQMRERLIGGGTVPMLRIGGNACGLTCLKLLGLLSFDLVIATPADSDETCAAWWWICQLLRHPGSNVTLWMAIYGDSSTGGKIALPDKVLCKAIVRLPHRERTRILHGRFVLSHAFLNIWHLFNAYAKGMSNEYTARLSMHKTHGKTCCAAYGLYGYNYRTGMPISVTNWCGSEVSPLSISVTSREKPVDFAYTEQSAVTARFANRSLVPAHYSAVPFTAIMPRRLSHA